MIKMNKKGVSLIAVLLFMLVATIAATATYKWLTSEGKSSASRLLQNEARLAAIAGIESARSWFANHGNETGAVVKQVLTGKKPVVLDSQLVSVKKDNQTYSVAAVEVDVSKQPYKIKVVSVGESRNGTKYSETAVFKVSGLYQVPTPTKKSSIKFEANYYGGDIDMSTNSTAESMIVNGNLEGSQVSVTKDLIVTGNVSQKGTNHIKFGENVCIGGNYYGANQGISYVENLYIHGDASSFSFRDTTGAMATGNVYFNGNVSLSGMGKDLIFDKNVTINGLYTGTSTGKPVTINGNLCLGENGSMNFAGPANANQGGFTANGNIWIPKGDAISGSGQSSWSYVKLGATGNDAYIQNANQCPGFYKEIMCNWVGCGVAVSPTKTNLITSSCPNGMYYQGSNVKSGSECVNYNWNANYCEENQTYDYFGRYAMFATTATLHSSVSGNPTFECAESIKTYCDEYLQPSADACGSPKSQFKVDDLLQSAKNTFGQDKYVTQCVKDVMSKDFATLKDGGGVDLLNNCYKNASSTDLYNSYLVVKAKAAKLNDIFTDPKVAFNGKFIIYVDEPENGPAKIKGKLPATSGPNSIVFMYLPNGAGEIRQAGTSGSTFRYFVFSEHDIDKVGTESAGEWYGSFYMSGKNCAKIKQLADGSPQALKYDKDLMDDLAENSIICDASEATCGGAPVSATPGAGAGTPTGSTDAGYDSEYIAVGTSLMVELESQYKTSEKVNNPESLKPSIVVLPRIVYLNNNATGQLRDYFTPVALNGARILGDGNLECPKNGNLASNPMVSGSEKMVPGIYSCSYSNNADGLSHQSDFYVVVGGSAEAVPSVNFDGENDVLLLTDTEKTTDIYLNISGVSEASGSFTVDITLTKDVDWTLVSHIGNATSTIGDVATYRYTGNISSVPQKIKLFSITTNSSSTTGNMIFRLQNPSNCVPTAPNVKRLTIRGLAIIDRHSVDEYCSEDNDEYCQNTVHWDESFKDIPSCDEMIQSNFNNEFEWVAAQGDSCVVLEGRVNNKWRCYTGATAHLVQKNASTIDRYCDVYIPNTERNEISSFHGQSQEVLYAEAKRKKKTIQIHLEDRGSGSATMYYSTVPLTLYELNNAISAGSIPSKVCNDDECDFDVYAGYHLYLRGNSTEESKFSVWKRKSDTNPLEFKTVQGDPFHIMVESDTSVYGFFNLRDEHCFYDDLKSVGAFCDDDNCTTDAQSCNCIDKCTESGNKDDKRSCSLTDGHYFENANWTMVAYNYPEGTKTTSCVKRGFLGRCEKRETVYTYFRAPKTTNGINFVRESFLGLGGGDGKNDGQESIILNRADAGNEGSFTASFDTENISYLAIGSRFLNSGFIFRSNSDASEYLTLSIYGKNLTGIELGLSYQMFARVCYNTAKTLKSNATCVEKEVKFGNLPAVANAFNKLSVEASLQGNTLDVSLGFQRILATDVLNIGKVSFNLAESPLKSLYATDANSVYNANKYVGMKLADDNFKIYDIAWRSNNEECWDTPYTSCSFAANFVGGRIPTKQDVMPWVNVSSWFTDKIANNKCIVKYYYNGCDMDETDGYRYESSMNSWLNDVISGVTCGDNPANDGYYWGTTDGGKNGAALRSNKQYSFTYEGLHGEVKSTPHAGIVRNASVVVSCDGIARNYVSNCGSFWVGTINECVKNEKILPNSNVEKISYYSSDIGNSKVLELENAINLRSASLQFVFGEGSGSVSFYLKDSEGRNSKNGAVSTTRNTINVDELIDEFGFDPENVSAIVFSSGDIFEITSINSNCANAATATCTYAAYNSTEQRWELTGTNTNADACEIVVTSNGETKSRPVSCTSFPMVIGAFGSEETLNSATDYIVSMRVVKGTETITCENPITVTLGSSGGSSSESTTPSTKTATCSYTTDSETGAVTYTVATEGCNSDCSVSVKNGDARTAYGSDNTSGFSQEIDVNGTYYVYFNESTTPISGCSGMVVNMRTPTTPTTPTSQTIDYYERGTQLESGKTYKINNIHCNDKTASGYTQIQFYYDNCSGNPSVIDCGNLISPNVSMKDNKYWWNENNACNGEGNTTLPITVTVPNGCQFRITNCW